ncbi:MAG: hypothetical protein B7Z80_06965 [Rhodospirillales bacterium 20-64-7]|nr:MAG: hypothetical protein B7Z80_06965 [Rhodospirillales bacterium 20-64-7]HQT76597.1 DUF1656 domain-containing protein [Rhodopila sp.]
MIGEINLYGVFVAPLLIWMLLAYGLSFPVRRLLSSVGFYRLVWHRALFDFALFVILLGIVTISANWIQS